MAKYLFQAKYVGDGLKGLLKDGGTSRVAAVKKLFESVGGTCESCYFGFGEFDIMGIADMPNNIAIASAALTVNASGFVDVKATAIITPEEMDEVAKKSPTYRGPGQ
jgi:uncharacterized protein with GYD domain